MAGTKLLTEKAHRDGSASHKNRADVNVVDKRITYNDLRKSSLTKKTKGTPMKMLIAQEMSKETDVKRKQSNVVAKLMGLDEMLPHQNFKKLENSYCGKEHKDIYEVSQQRSQTNHFKTHSLNKDMYAEIQNEIRMALVREKFMEAKRLAKDESLLGSKEFQDAVEVLSSNRDLFLKFLEEPNSLVSKHLNELHSYQTSRITLLKPSKSVEKKQSYPANQPTRIVILKPSPVKHHMVIKDDFNQFSNNTEPANSIVVTKNIARHMRQSISRRDESLLSSSVLSNGYVGDESSFHRSEDDSKFSDSDISSPISRHTLDYSNRFGSPYSLSSCSRASYSPEPSVIREAKKRLSERLSMVASNKNNREQNEIQRSTSTLAEMLSIPEVKQDEVRVRRSYGGEEDLILRTSSESSSTCQMKEANMNLSRSRSLPVSSNFEFNSEVNTSPVKKPIVTKDVAKSKNGKLSFKGKVSSLFFSKTKKGVNEKSISSNELSSNKASAKENKNLLNSVCHSEPESCHPVSSEEESMKASPPTLVISESNQEINPFRDVLSLEKRSTSDCSTNEITENQNQPSPTSILDAPFESDTSNNTPDTCEISNRKHSTPPVVSVARTLSWDDTNFDTLLPDTSKNTFFFIQSILSITDLDNKNLNAIFSKWHSAESPLDPKLLDKLLDYEEKYANSRDSMSNQKLIFDCINYALLEISKDVYLSAYPPTRICNGSRKKLHNDASIVDEVWLLISGWFSSEGSKLDLIESYGLVVDRLLRTEVGGSEWHELMLSEIDAISTEISGVVLDELVGEAFQGIT